MIGPTASDIIAMRWRVRVVLRVLAALLATAGLAWATIRVPEFLQYQKMAGWGRVATPRYFEPRWFGLPTVMLAGSIALVLVARFGLWVLVPVPKPNCPGCGYDLNKPSGDRCPECGLRLAPPAPSRANDPP